MIVPIIGITISFLMMLYAWIGTLIENLNDGNNEDYSYYL